MICFTSVIFLWLVTLSISPFITSLFISPAWNRSASSTPCTCWSFNPHVVSFGVRFHEVITVELWSERIGVLARRGTRRPAPSLCICTEKRACEGTAGTQPSASQEKSPHQEANQPEPWTSSLKNYEKDQFLFKPVSLWHFVTAAWTD